jgi:hypothetical protein
MLERGDGLLGWATDDLVRLDGLALGLIGRVLVASPMRRQAIFTVLASRSGIARHNDPATRSDRDDDPALAVVLRDGRARDILAFGFGDVPEGWMGALARLGGQLMKVPNTYQKLHATFTDPAHRKKAEALRYVGEITEPMLMVLNALDERWVHVEALKRLPNLVAAKDFNRALALAQSVSSKATDEAVAAAIARLPPSVPFSALVDRFIRQADRFPVHPISEPRTNRPADADADRHRRHRKSDRDQNLRRRPQKSRWRSCYSQRNHECGWWSLPH